MANYNSSFVVNAGDLAKILEQIKIAERNAAGESLVDIIGQDAALLPMGLRTVDGSFNHLLPGQSLAGAADQIFPRLLTPHYINEADGDTQMLAPPGTPGLPPGGLFVTNTNYDPTIAPGSSPFGVNNHSVADADPRIISNLIVDQTLTNRSALVAALLVVGGGANGGDIAAATAQADVILAARATAATASSPANIAALQTALNNATTANTAAQANVTTAQAAVTAAQGSVTTAQTNLGTEQAQGAAANAALSVEVVDMSVATNAYIAAVASVDTADDAPALAVLTTAISELNAAQATVTQEGLDLAVATVALNSAQGDLATNQTGLTAAQTAAATTQLAINTAQAALTAATGAGTAFIQLVADSGLSISPDGSILIEQRSADIGLSPANSAWMAFFGQFFDHGLDLVTKGGNGTIYIPLQADDPLIAGADHIFGNADDLPASQRFMALSRTTPFDANGNPSPTGTESQNTTTPFVDQNQTYTSNASHQVFLREYKFSVDAIADINNTKDSFAVNTGHLLNGVNGGIANWAEVKAQSAEKLGLQLSDIDVLDVPKLMVDAYGNFIPGAHGFAQVYVKIQAVNADGSVAGTVPGEFIMEGIAGGLNIHALAPPSGLPAPPAGSTYVVSTVGTGHAFLNDIAHNAVPGTIFDTDGNPATPGVSVVQADTDNAIGNGIPLDFQGHKTAYDDELLAKHFITGDGRGNENIGLTAVHTIFHSEHNRLVEANKDTLVATGDVNVVNQWLAAGPGGVRSAITQADLDVINGLTGTAKADAIDNLDWDGGRLFQAGRFVTEMQYQHLVFEEFARRVQPGVDPFVFTNSADLNPAIVAEFAHTVYRFGHSMLTDTVDRLDNNLNVVDGNPNLAGDQQIGLIRAFLNPLAFTASAGTTSSVSDESAVGALVRGMSRQTGNEIDEFVVEALRNNLLGLPLDLPALNIARGREQGIATLNDARAELYAMTGAADVKPYLSWTDFAQNIKHPLSVINFIAAYGTHAALTVADVNTLQEKKDVAFALVMGGSAVINAGGVGGVEHTFTADNADRLDFLHATGAYAGGTLGGLNAIDLWVGGLAEKLNEFGGQLGSTFNFIFEYQMEHLQNGDRFYYLSRTQGMNLLNLLEPNTFTDLVMRNTDLGDIHSTHLPGNLMSVDDYIFELDREVRQTNYSGNAALDGTDPLNRSDLDPSNPDAFEQAHIPKVFRQEGTARAGAFDAENKQIYDGGILRFTGGEHVVLGGTEGNDSLYGSRGIDTLWGDAGNDYLNAGMESDQVFGGDGDDIIEDPFGANFLRGEGGDDVIASDQGLTLMFGGEGNDFIMGNTDTKEAFAGPGNDFVLGGSAADVLLGNEGDDWIEGGEGLDNLSGENSELFFNSPIIGHDILNGQGNDTDYDGESGDDIMVQGIGIQRNNGMLGFDWSIQKGDENDGLIDLGISRFLTQTALTLRDRNDSVEGASGWKHNDTIIGTTSPVGAVGAATGPVGGPLTDSNLLSQNVQLIHGMDAFLALTPGALRGQTVDPTNVNFASLANDTTVFDPHNGGDILLGGAGSDLIIGKAGNDLIDGDRWLNVRISVHETKVSAGASPQMASFDGLTSQIKWTGSGLPPSWQEMKLDPVTHQLTGTGQTWSLAQLMRTGVVNPGQLEAVRELITDGASAADTDVAFYFGSRADFTITQNANGTVTITDNVVTPILGADGVRIPLLNDEGTDTLSNIEIARFTNYGANGIPTGTFTDVFIAPRAATGAPVIIDANGGTPTEGQLLTLNTTSIADLNGIASPFSFQWQVAAVDTAPNGAWNNIGGATAATFTPGQAQVNQIVRVDVSFTDGIGTTEHVFSAASQGVGDLFNGTINADTPVLTAFDDVANGAGGADVLNGLAGNDQLNGDGGADTLNGGDGNDALDGGAGLNDTASYAGATAGVTVSLAVVAAQNTGGAGTDTLSNIENLIGSSQGDTLTGNILSNSLDGGLGTDTGVFTGSVNLKSFALVAGNVQVTSSIIDTDTLTSIETLRFSEGVDLTLVQGTNLGNTLNGAAGAVNEIILGFGGVDTINAGDGNDVVFGGTGNDAINGGIGDDTIVWNVGDGRDLIDGAASTPAGDRFVLNGSLGQTETFRIFAVAGAANAASRAALVLQFGALNANTEVVVTRQVGVGAQALVTELDNIEEITINGAAITVPGAPGTALGDTILVNGNFSPTSLNFNTITINGGGGDDAVDVTGMTSAHHVVLNTGGGTDRFIGQRFQDVFNVTVSGDGGGTGSGGDDSGSGDNGGGTGSGGSGQGGSSGSGHHDGDEDLIGTKNSDRMDGGKGSDKVSAGAGNDTIMASADDGDDNYHGGSGTDTYNLAATSHGATVNLTSGRASSTQTGHDTLTSIENAIGSSGDDTIYGNKYANKLSGGAGNDNLQGKGGHDTVSGGTGDDKVYGQAGNDRLYGNAGDDRMYGGNGDDALTGGAGSDTFVFGPGFGHDTINDFDANPSGGQDYIDIHAFGFTQATFAEHVLIMGTAGGTTVAIDGFDNTIFLKNITNPLSVTIDDFRL